MRKERFIHLPALSGCRPWLSAAAEVSSTFLRLAVPISCIAYGVARDAAALAAPGSLFIKGKRLDMDPIFSSLPRLHKTLALSLPAARSKTPRFLFEQACGGASASWQPFIQQQL